MHRSTLVGGIVLLLVAAALAAACGGGDGAPVVPTLHTYKGTQPPGDVWTYVLGAGSFAATNETLGYHYAGTTASLPNGYLRLDVTSSDDPGLVGDLPVAAYALELPGVVLFVDPTDDDGRLTACVAVGATPVEEVTYNYVKLPHADWGSGPGGADEEEVWGQATSSISGPSGQQFDFWIELWDLGNLTAAPTKTEWAGETFTATGGWLVPDVGDQRVGITPPGLFVQDSGPDHGGSMGVQAPDSPIGTGTLFAGTHAFLGYVFEHGAPGDDTRAAWATIAMGDGYLSGGELLDGTSGFDDAAPGPEQVRITFTSEVRSGVFRGVLAEPGGDGTFGTGDDATKGLVMVAGEVFGRWFLLGTVEPGGPTSKPADVVLVEQ